MAIFGKRKKILYAPPRGIGDMIFSLPLLHSLHQGFPSHEIGVVIPDRAALKEIIDMTGFAKPCPIFLPTPKEDPLAYERWKASQARDHRKKEEFEKQIYDKYLSGQRYDLAILPKRFKIATLDCENQINREDLLKKGLDYHNLHEVDGFLLFADLLGIPKSTDFKLTFREKDNPNTIHGSQVISSSPYVVFNLGASNPDRKWQPEKIAEVTEFLRGKGLNSIIIGTSEEYVDGLKLKETPYRINLIPKEGIMLDLRNYALLASRAKCVVGTDSGLLHLADATGAKVIGLYGPGNPRNCGPYHNLNNVLSRFDSDKKVSNILAEDVIHKLEEIL